jgi:hypothetical protein
VFTASSSEKSSTDKCVAVKGRSPRSGQAATSSASNPAEAAHPAISSRSNFGMHAVKNPSFI